MNSDKRITFKLNNYSIGYGIVKAATIFAAVYLWTHGYQNGWVIAMFIVGIF